MKTFIPPYCAQGDVNLFAVDIIPDGLSPTKLFEGRLIVGHSETGHHHVIEGNCVRAYDQDEFISYLDVEKECKVVHLRQFDTHEPIALPPGKYKIARQREYTIEGFRLAQD